LKKYIPKRYDISKLPQTKLDRLRFLQKTGMFRKKYKYPQLSSGKKIKKIFYSRLQSSKTSKSTKSFPIFGKSTRSSKEMRSRTGLIGSLSTTHLKKKKKSRKQIDKDGITKQIILNQMQKIKKGSLLNIMLYN
jgi:hypothetical protein